MGVTAMIGTVARMRALDGSALLDLSKEFDDPVQGQLFRQLVKLIESEPEWHDGDVVHTAHTHFTGRQPAHAR